VISTTASLNLKFDNPPHHHPAEMAQFYQPPQQPNYSAQNLQFYPSTYGAPISDPSAARFASPYGSTPQQAGGSSAYPSYGTPTGFMSSAGFGQAGPGATGRIGEQGGLRTGWLAAFGTEGYDGEPPLLEELGVNFGHIKVKVGYENVLNWLRNAWALSLYNSNCR
jgi:hypothetical protein